MERTEEIGRAIALMALLRSAEGCAWDREQTFQTIKRHTLEETYEVFDAIDRQDWPALKDELGDLLLQVLFYAQMAEESGYFSVEMVGKALSDKLVRRHPHIFGDVVATTPDEVNRTWEAVKRAERGAGAGDAPTGLLWGVKRYVPGMMEATKLGAKAASVGFDWPDTKGLLAKINEECAELVAEMEKGDAEGQEDELGDVLFTVMNLARHLKVDPETALKRANTKFRTRFTAMEEAAGGAAALQQMDADELERRWQRAKQDLVTEHGRGAESLQERG